MSAGDKINQIRAAAEADLQTFIELVHPKRFLGNIHKEVLQWWYRQDAKAHQLLLLPRDHMKSALAAYRVAWEITKNPALRVLYISSTSNLAEKQLGFIKDILTSKVYRRYWPEMVHAEEGKRKKWTNTEIMVDDPRRAAEAIRDPTIFAAGLTTGITGMHFDIIVLDDVVVQENAYTEEGRLKVTRQYSLLASIAGTDSREWVVGTRYHPLDLYNDMKNMTVPVFNDDGEFLREENVYEIFERQVEDHGDGMGEFLWPRQQRPDGQWFGFNAQILATKKAKYLDKTQFYAQYYNNPNDPESAPLDRNLFQYYNKALIHKSQGRVYYGGKPLNVFASVDFAFSLAKKADFTAICVVGVDADHNYYILEISRFKGERIKDYYEEIVKLHNKWGFRKIRAEATAAQAVIVKELKEEYIKRQGLALSVDEHKPTRHEGTKAERIKANLHPRYENQQVWHYRGGNCEVLEEELVLENPPHDDVKDSLAACFEVCVAPTGGALFQHKPFWEGKTNSRFGGMG